MTFWNDQNFEPKRVFRWKVQFTLSEQYIPSKYIKSVKKPSFTFNSKRVQGLGYAVNVAQQAQYQPVEITLIDDETNAITDWVYKYFANAGILFDGNQGAQTCIDTEKAKRNADDIEIQMIDAEGNKLEMWELKNAWISSFSQTDLNYESSDLATYTMTLTYDWFAYKSSDKSDNISTSTSPDNTSDTPSQEGQPKPKKPRPGPSAMEFPELFPPGPSNASAFASDRKVFEYAKTPLANVSSLDDSMTVREENYRRDSTGRRILGTDNLDK